MKQSIINDDVIAANFRHSTDINQTINHIYTNYRTEKNYTKEELFKLYDDLNFWLLSDDE